MTHLAPAKNIIEAIKRLDLITYPYEDALQELRKIGSAGLVVNTLHPGYKVIRV